MSVPSNREEAIFEEALAIESQRAREAYLREACGDDVAMRERLQGLLGAHQRAGRFLEHSQPEPGAPLSIPPSSLSGGPADAPGQAATVNVEKAGDRIGRFELLEQIGEGGFGVVWMAEQEEPVRRRVALKVIKAGMDTREIVARFEAERQALALMDHPCIAKVFDGGATETGRPYFVMELVRGIRITDYCDQRQLPVAERLKLLIQICQAVQHAHQKAIVHRDLKPPNILVTVNDGVAVPKVIDFGIAKALEGRLTDKTVFTRFQQFIGTPAYTSPEQAEMTSLDIDTRSDIYSLGVLLYELLVGHTPFDPKELLDAGLDELRRKIREKEPVRPSTRLSRLARGDLTNVAARRQTEAPKLIHQLRGDLDWIVMKCLEKDRARRYATANGLAADLQRHLDHEPVLARPASSFYRFRKLVRRNKLVVGAVGILAASLIVGFAVSTTLFFREAEARKLASEEASKNQQVARFLQDMLQGVGPSVARGRDTTMLREILAKTAGRLDQGLHGQPEVQAELLNTLGEVSVALAEFGQAETWLATAVALRRRMPGRQQAALAKSLDNLANAFRGKGQLVDAEKIGREALELRRQLFGNGDTNVAASLNNLGVTLTIQGKLAEAEAAIRQALGIRTNRLGAENPEVAVSFNCLASATNAIASGTGQNFYRLVTPRQP